MDWAICSVKDPCPEAVSEEIAAIQEAGWRRKQIQSALADPAARAWIARRKDVGAAGAVGTEGTRVAAGGGIAGPTPAVVGGFVLARRIVDLLEIDLVGVRPSMRRVGVARGLLEALLGVEGRAGLSEARLELASANQAAQRLYDGLGFVVVGRRTRYYPDGDDALILSRIFS